MLEEIPKSSDKRWKSIDKTYKIINVLNDNEYNVTQTTIDEVKTYKSLDEIKQKYNIDKIKEENNATDYKIASIYCITDGYKNYIGYTSYPIIYLMKSNLFLYENGEEGYIDNFCGDLINIKFRLIEYVLYKNIHEIRERKNYQKENIGEQIKNYTIEQYYNKYLNIYDNIIKKREQLISNKTYIYELKNIKNNKKFINYTMDEIRKDSPDKIIKYDLEVRIEKDKLKDKEDSINNVIFSVLKEFTTKSDFECEYSVDKYIITYDSIDRGYNDKYLLVNDMHYDKYDSYDDVVKLRQFINLQITKRMFENKFIDDNNYKNILGFIYQIKCISDNKKFIGYHAYQENRNKITFKKIIEYMYNKEILKLKRYTNEKKISKSQIHILLSKPYNDLEFKILEIKTDKNNIDLKNRVNELITEYDTINNGYNVNERKLIANSNVAKSQKIRDKKYYK